MKREVIVRPIADLEPYARNARVHTEEQVVEICGSMKRFGFLNPVLTRGSGILAGHGRVLAAAKLGWTHVPTIALDHLTDAQARAYVLADNKLAELAGWDYERLHDELVSLRDGGEDVHGLGIPKKELDHILRGWNPDDAWLAALQETSTGVLAKITVLCEQGDREGLVRALQAALQRFEGVMVE